MPNEPVLVDTGPLLALYNVRDPLHDACCAQAGLLPLGKAFTCWPVITEAAYMLRKYPADREHLLNEVREEEFILLPLRAVEVAGIQTVYRRYHDQDVDLADASLVHLANRENIQTVFTTDRRHFGVFRLSDGQPFRLLPELSG